MDYLMAHRPTFEQRNTTSEPGQFREELSTVGNVQAFPIGTLVGLAENGDARFPELVLGKTLESVVSTGTAPLIVASTTVVANLNSASVAGVAGGDLVKRDGSTALTANWDVGSFQVRAETFQSDVATGTAPFTVASTTVVANLNAATLGGTVKGSSGSAIPLLDAANTWSADQLFSTTTNLQLDNSSQFLKASDSTTVVLNAVTSLAFGIGGFDKATLTSTDLDVAASVTALKFISDVADGTEPYATTSLTLNTNLNADMLDGKHIGTSGNTVPLLDGTNTWSADQLLATTTKLFLDNTDNYLHATSVNTVVLNAESALGFGIGGVLEGVFTTSGLDVGNSVTAEKFISDVSDGTEPYATTSTTLCTNLNADRVDGIEGAEIIQRDGSVPLTADWDAGAFEIRAETFESDVTTGTAPLVIASTTVVSNLNADMLDGKHVGTSGSTIPLLDTAQTWSAVQTFGTTTKLQFHDSANYLHASTSTLVVLNAATFLSLAIGGTAEATVSSAGLDVVKTVKAKGFRADGDSGSATAGTVELTGVTVAASSGTPTFPNLIAGGVAGGVGWIKIYVTAGAVYVPYWR